MVRMRSATSSGMRAGVISSAMLAVYLASKSKKSFLLITSVIGNTWCLPLVLYNPQVSSVPLMYCSTITSSPSVKAFWMAASRSDAVVTFDTPKLEPPALGFTKQGRPVFSAISNLSYELPLRSITESATVTPKPLR